MTPEEALVDVTSRLKRLGVAHALVGGLAVSIRAEVRFTRDVDLALSVDSDVDCVLASYGSLPMVNTPPRSAFWSPPAVMVSVSSAPPFLVVTL